MSTIRTKEQWATRAMKNAETRAAVHRAEGRYMQAAKALAKGAQTAQLWLLGQHPKQDKAA